MRTLILLMTATSAVAAPQKVSVEKRDIKATLRLGVTASPHLWAQLAAPASGMVKQVFVDLSSRVKKGEKLAMLGAKDSIVAPFDGVVVSRNALPGVWVHEGDPLFTVMDATKMRLELEVAETDAAKIAVGMPVTARFEAFPNQVFQAKVSVIVPMIDARTHRLHADADMDNAAMTVMAGMAGEASIAMAMRPNVLAIPLAAVKREGAEWWVNRAGGGKTKVALGVDDGEWVEVLTGLSPTDAVMVEK